MWNLKDGKSTAKFNVGASLPEVNFSVLNNSIASSIQFLDGVRTYVHEENMLHAHHMHIVTVTGRKRTLVYGEL